LKKIIFLIVSIVTISIIGGFIYINKIYGTTTNIDKNFFIIKNEDSIDSVVLKLKEKNIIISKKYFLAYKKLRYKNRELKPGNYIINPHISIKDLIFQLSSGKSDFAIITIPEGYSLFQTADRLEKNKLLKKEEFINIKLEDVDKNNLINNPKTVHFSLEGFLFPETYYIPYAYSKEQIAQSMYNNFTKVFSEEYRNRTKELGLNINDIITIASLIEKEAANDAERSRISGVIYNRLKRGMLLQIDAAVIYAITKGEKTIQRVTYSNLKVNSPYNTYINKGLPPGPIAAPGKPSIHAALYPETHDYLFYVAGEGGHVFSRTYEEHLQNVKKYRK
jgi:UPF0755 protein